MENEPKVAAPAVARAARILDLLAQAAGPVSLATLARDLPVPKSSLHGLCATLIELRLIRRHDNGDMVLGPHVMSWANAFLSTSDDIVQAFYGALQDLKTLPEETITLAIPDAASVVYVTSRRGTRAIGVTFRAGMRLPAPFTATGKAMLSTRDDGSVRQLLAGAWPGSLTAASVAGIRKLLTQLEETRLRGYSIDDGEIREGLYCIGAPVFDSGSTHAVAGVAVSFLSHQVDDAVQAEAGHAMRVLADKLSERLGASGQPGRQS